jgi:hypothetical protein
MSTVSRNETEPALDGPLIIDVLRSADLRGTLDILGLARTELELRLLPEDTLPPGDRCQTWKTDLRQGLIFPSDAVN